MVMGMAITIMPSYSGKPGHITIMLLPAALLPGMQGGGGVTVRRGGGGAGTVYNRPPAIVTSLQNFPKNTNRSCAGGGRGGAGHRSVGGGAGAGAERASAGANIGRGMNCVGLDHHHRSSQGSTARHTLIRCTGYGSQIAR